MSYFRDTLTIVLLFVLTFAKNLTLVEFSIYLDHSAFNILEKIVTIDGQNVPFL